MDGNPKTTDHFTNFLVLKRIKMLKIHEGPIHIFDKIVPDPSDEDICDAFVDLDS